MPERVTIYDLDSGEPRETFAVDAVEIVKSDPTRYAYKLPSAWAPKPPVSLTVAPVAPPSAPEPPRDPDGNPPAEGNPAPAPAPAAPAEPEPLPLVADDDAEKDALRAEAEKLGIDVDNRWGISTLKTKIAAAKAAA